MNFKIVAIPATARLLQTINLTCHAYPAQGHVFRVDVHTDNGVTMDTRAMFYQDYGSCDASYLDVKFGYTVICGKGTDKDEAKHKYYYTIIQMMSQEDFGQWWCLQSGNNLDTYNKIYINQSSK